MRDEMKNNLAKTRKPVTIEKLQDDVEVLRDELRRLEIQMATLSNIETGKIISAVDAGEPPHPATGKCQKCKNCKHVRLPHKSNAHYTCEMRHATVEPTWTCGMYKDKNKQMASEPVSYCGH